jgi:single-strand DNA-binding protein
LIEGRLTADQATGGPRIWTKQDGSAGASFEISAQIVRFLSTRQEDEAFQGSSSPMGNEPAMDDDIPF